MFYSYIDDVLFQLTDMYQVTVNDPHTSPGRRALANQQLDMIEEEFQRRQPEGEFQEMLGEEGEPVGFEPVYEI